MLPVKKEVLSFVHACDALHVLLGRGDTLTPEERDLIEVSANELLSKLRPA
jgi:hypothetical protein